MMRLFLHSQNYLMQNHQNISQFNSTVSFDGLANAMIISSIFANDERSAHCQAGIQEGDGLAKGFPTS